MPRKLVTTVISASLLLVPLLSACGKGATTSSASHTSDTVSRTGTLADVPNVVRKVEPAVVTLVSGRRLGSGVVWSDGVIVTDDHVVHGSHTVTVGFADGRRTHGTVAGEDPVTDIAIVRVSRRGLPTPTFSKALPAVGDMDVVIGSPLGLQETVSAGIISGEHRDLPASHDVPVPLLDLLQTDAPISPGNSGGPVVDAKGTVVGLAEAYVPPQAGAVAIGFVTPSTTLQSVVPQLLSGKQVRHPYLGVVTRTLTPQIARALGTRRHQGVVVLGVGPGTPAAKAGVQPGDIVIKVDGQPTPDDTALYAELNKHRPGDTVTLELVRNGRDVQVSVRLTERPQHT